MLAPFELVQFDTEAAEPIRNHQGFCIPVGPGEAGLLLTQVSGHNPFSGYRGPRELSERKLVRNVRRTGDVYVNTGDVLAMDHEGFLYFRDRLGDTFRLRLRGQGRWNFLVLVGGRPRRQGDASPKGEGQ